MYVSTSGSTTTLAVTFFLKTNMPTIDDKAMTTSQSKRISVKHLIDKSKELDVFVPWFCAILGIILFFAIVGFILEQLGCLKSKIIVPPKRRSCSTINQSREKVKTVGEHLIDHANSHSSHGDNLMRPSQRQKSIRSCDGPPAEGYSVEGKQKADLKASGREIYTHKARPNAEKHDAKETYYEENCCPNKRMYKARRGHQGNRKKEKPHTALYARESEDGERCFRKSVPSSRESKLHGRYKKPDGSSVYNKSDEYGEYNEKPCHSVGRHKEARPYGRRKRARVKTIGLYEDKATKRHEKTYEKGERKHEKRTLVRPSMSDLSIPLGRRANDVESMPTQKNKTSSKYSANNGNMSIGRRNRSTESVAVGKRLSGPKLNSDNNSGTRRTKSRDYEKSRVRRIEDELRI